VTAGKSRQKKVVDYQLDFSAPLDDGSAQNIGHYGVVQPGRTKRSALKSVPILSATYNSGNNSVTLALGKSTAGKPLTLTASGLVSLGGEPVEAIVTNL
jgi:hypothetical protein